MILSKFAVCDNKTLRFIKKQEAKGLLRNLGLKTLLSKNPLLGNIWFQRHKINEIGKKIISGR